MPIAKGVRVVACGQDMRRVSLFADGVNVDLALPAAVPVAALLPSIVDILSTKCGLRTCIPACYQLSCPGMSAFDSSTTLAQNAIHDGAVLVLNRSSTEPPVPSFDDAAEAVSATLAAAARPWTRRTPRLTGAVVAVWLAGLGGALLMRITHAAIVSHLPGNTIVVAIAGCSALLAAAIAHRVYRDEIAGLTLGLLAAGFAAVAGFLAVPDGPGAPNVLLAAMAAGAISVLAMRLSGCGAITLTTVACLATLIAGAGLAAVITMAPLRVIGSISVLASLGLLEVSARFSIAWAGLSPQLSAGIDDADPETPDKLRLKALRADGRLTSLVVASACAAAAGAICTAIGTHATGGHRLAGVVFATMTAAVLLLRARSQTALTRTLALVGTGTATLSAAFVLTADVTSQHPTWLATGIAVLTAAAMYLGFVAPGLTFSPVARRSVELLEYMGLAAIVPLACWICGFYSAARGLRLI